MRKTCKCGASMAMRLRTVIYLNKVEIDDVPIFSCEHCQRSEVFPGVKQELTNLISELGAKPVKQTIPFDDRSELARLIKSAMSKERQHQPIESILEERINELLDLLLVAQSLQDRPWMQDIRARLSQITKTTITAGGL